LAPGRAFGLQLLGGLLAGLFVLGAQVLDLGLGGAIDALVDRLDGLQKVGR